MWKNFKVRLNRARLAHYLHDGHGLAHLVYFGAVFAEGHGLYSVMGGVLGAIMVLQFFLGGDE